MEEQLYLVFAERIGEDNNGNYFYRLLFSDNPEVVWGNNFNITPAGIIPELEPDSAAINKEFTMTTKIKLETAVESTWFSLQDCIDGIISLLFVVDDDIVVNIPFGFEYDDLLKYIEPLGWKIDEVEYKPKNIEDDGEEA